MENGWRMNEECEATILVVLTERNGTHQQRVDRAP